MTNFYWYSTNGMAQHRLPSRHFAVLDQAFERHTRIQIYDDEIFGANVPALANPYQGTMTAGDLHFGLYRHPPIWRMSDVSLDTLTFIGDSNFTDEDKSTRRDSHGNMIQDKEMAANDSTDTKNLKYRTKQRRRIMIEEDCINCCVIS